MKTSAPAIASASVRASVSTAIRSLIGFIPFVRPTWTTPVRSQNMILAASKPAAISIVRVATPAAPAPRITTRTCARLFPCISSALISPAVAMIAVPCWSSWKQGMSSASTRRSSISKHSGALMSSRLMPPKVGAISLTAWMNCSGSFVATSMSKTSIPAKRLKRTPFPSITGFPARAPMSPRPRTAVPLVITATRLPRLV